MAGNSRFSARDTMFFLNGSNCSGATLIACETASAGVIDLKSSTVSASGSGTNNIIAEISQTAPGSQIILGYTNLEYQKANGLGFTLNQTPFNILYGAYGNNIQAAEINNKFLNAGTVPATSLGTTSGQSIPYTLQQSGLVHNYYFRTNVANTGTSNVTALLYSNNPGIPSNLIAALTLSGTATIVSNDITSIRIPAGESIYVQLSSSYASGQIPMNRFVVDIGVF